MQTMAIDLEFALMMRAIAARGMDDMTFLHNSIRNDAMAAREQFLINAADPRPFWASKGDDFVCVNADGSSNTERKPNSQWWIHKEIYRLRPEFRCILHVHTAETIAVASLAKVRQVHQGAALFSHAFLGHMSYKGLNRYDGLAEAFGVMGYAVLMEGHGAMVGGRTPGEAFEILVNLQDACHKELTIPKGVFSIPAALVRSTHEEWIKGGRPFGAHSWPAERDAMYEDAISRGEGL